MRSRRITRQLRNEILGLFRKKYLNPAQEEVEKEFTAILDYLYREHVTKFYPEVSLDDLPKGLLKYTSEALLDWNVRGRTQSLRGEFSQEFPVPANRCYYGSMAFSQEADVKEDHPIHKSMLSYLAKKEEVKDTTNKLYTSMDSLLMSCYSFQTFKEKYPKWQDFCPDYDSVEDSSDKNLPAAFKPADAIENMLSRLQGEVHAN